LALFLQILAIVCQADATFTCENSFSCGSEEGSYLRLIEFELDTRESVLDT